MLTVHTFCFNAFQENTYVVFNNEKEAIIIDPGCYLKHEEAQLANFISENNLAFFSNSSSENPLFKNVEKQIKTCQNKIDKAPSFNLKDSQLFNYTIAKTSLQAIAKQLSMPYQDSTPNNADWANVQGAGRALKAGQQLQMASDSTMPDISGMKLKDALWLCEKQKRPKKVGLCMVLPAADTLPSLLRLWLFAWLPKNF